MFIPDELKPKQKPVDETTLSYIFSVLDEMLEVLGINNTIYFQFFIN